MARIRFALRSLAKAPLLSLVVVLSLGLGIGANTAIFSLLNQVVLSSLPVQRPEELVLVTSPGDFKSGCKSADDAGGTDYVFSYKVFRGLESNAGVAGLASFRNLGANIAFGKQTHPGTVAVVSGQYFPMLGVKPLMGRTILPEDDREGRGNPVAMVSYGYWMDKLGGEPVLNQPIRINGHSFTLVGIAPKGFTGTTLGQEPDTYVPLVFNPQMTPNLDSTKPWNDYWLYLVARLKPGTSRAQAEAALNGPYAALLEEQSKTESFRSAKNRERFLKARLTLKDGRQGNSSFRDGTRMPVLILMVATALVLLIAMANAANLLLARSAQRRRELAIRSAMGAGRGELMGQMLTEALLLTAGGALAGLLLGRATLALLVAKILAGGEDPIHFITPELNWVVLGFSLALSLLTGLVFGLYPAWEAARSSMAVTLKDESGQSSGTRGTARVRKVLVCAQVMVSLLLLIPAGLFLKSLVNLLHVDLGMKTENLVGFSVSPSLNGYKNEQARALFERMETELAAIPGVRSVAAGMVPLIGGSNWGSGVKVEGRPSRDQDQSMFNVIGPGYFGKLGIPLIAGREFTGSDNLAGPKVAVVNEEFVKKILDGRNPIGVRFGSGKADMEIVGVVKNSHYSAVKQNPPVLYYTPWRQNKEPSSLCFYLRSAIPSAQTIPQVRRVVASLDPDLPPENLRTLDDQILNSVQNDRVILQLAATFAVLATALAMLGLYGVMAHSVTRRTREIGIRMALGAGPDRIRGMVMREMLWILLAGVLVGVPGALALAKVTESQLYGVKSRDAVVVASAVLALAVTAALAAFLPARKASRVNPLNALRYE